MHTETLLNPFYQVDYVTQNDGQNHTVFTNQVQEASTAKKTEIDAIEDVLLDDFSFGDEDSEGHS